jgi:mono/diheme cytochrome c family protein
VAYNKKTLILVSGLLFLVAGWANSAWSAEAKAGKAIYDKSCAGCHGADGKGNPAMAKVLGEKGLNLTTKEVVKMSDEKALKIIAEGAGKMPAQKSLSKDDQKNVLGYMRSLSK